MHDYYLKWPLIPKRVDTNTLSDCIDALQRVMDFLFFGIDSNLQNSFHAGTPLVRVGCLKPGKHGLADVGEQPAGPSSSSENARLASMLQHDGACWCDLFNLLFEQSFQLERCCWFSSPKENYYLVKTQVFGHLYQGLAEHCFRLTQIWSQNDVKLNNVKRQKYPIPVSTSIWFCV